MASPEELLEQVTDRDSFIAFVESLAAEREDAAGLERDNPKTYVLDGAHNWKNGDIEGFLYGALQYFDEGPLHKPESEPSWRVFAEILWCGKIME
jgi:hypothetical protein